MSALGQKQTLTSAPRMSALPPKADIDRACRDVRFVPKADILQCGRNWHYSITSSARTSNEGRPYIMTDLISGDVLTTLAQVVMIDLVLAGDNAVVIGLAAAGLPDKQRKRAILIGIVVATVLRIVGATIATQLLQVLGLL